MKKHELFAALLLVPMLIFSSCTKDEVQSNKETTIDKEIIKTPSAEPQEPPVLPAAPVNEAVSYKLKDKGNKIREIQQKLNKFDYGLVIDGNFGVNTQNAVIDFQKRNKISVNGIVDSVTLDKLNLAPTSATTYTPPAQTPSNGISTKTDTEAYINAKNLPSDTNFLIWIDLKNQKVNIFSGSNHKWVLIKSMLCSSGKSSTPTIKGNFKVGNKGTYFTTSYTVGGKTITARCKYFTQIKGNYLFHSIIYDKTGEKVVDGTLGTPRSHGCVRLAVENAKYIYDNIPRDTAIWSN